MDRQTLQSQYKGFTFVEVMIVVAILAIIAMAAMPRFADSANDARESALVTDLKTVRHQIDVYRAEHNGRGPEFDEGGVLNTTDFVFKMIFKTTREGELDSTSTLGPYLPEWPANPFCTEATAKKVNFGSDPAPPRDGTSGWYYDTVRGKLFVNSFQGAEAYDN